MQEIHKDAQKYKYKKYKKRSIYVVQCVKKYFAHILFPLE